MVEVRVAPEGTGSRLHLVHSVLTETSAAEYSAGWQAYVLALEAHLDGAETGDWWEPFAATKNGYAAAMQ